ncbi:hypothetical protein [Egbenema bharatensis]|uniref:hypothetical protein n=1 Tax=Egbenema bharatensis TaxID=3463334 RepID=UPI003A8C35DE
MNRLFFAGISAVLLSTTITSVAQAETHTTDAPNTLPDIEAFDERRPEDNTGDVEVNPEVNPDDAAQPNETPDIEAFDERRPEEQDRSSIDVRYGEQVAQRPSQPSVDLPNMHVLREYNNYPYSVRESLVR